MVSNQTGLAVLGILAIAVGGALFFVSPARQSTPASASGKQSGKVDASSVPSSLGQAPGSRSGWIPPDGDPVLRYRELRGGGAQARKDLISNFMALGHDRNPYLLIEALGDSDPGVRLQAVECAASLTVGEATAVLATAASNADADVREMAWSLAAPYPVESRVNIYSGALRNGGDLAMTEALSEMGIRPEKPLFEMMLTEAIRPNVGSERQARLLEELQVWLEPGGGEVPQFQNPTDLAQWWQSQLINYDEYMLRTDE